MIDRTTTGSSPSKMVLENPDLLWNIFSFFPSCQLGKLHVCKQWKEIASLLMNRRIPNILKDITVVYGDDKDSSWEELKFDRIVVNSDRTIDIYPVQNQLKMWDGDFVDIQIIFKRSAHHYDDYIDTFDFRPEDIYTIHEEKLMTIHFRFEFCL